MARRAEVEVANSVKPRKFHKRGTSEVALKGIHVVEKAKGQKVRNARKSF